MNAAGIIGLIMLFIGVIVLVIWSRGADAFIPGIILVGGGIVLLWLSGREGKS